MRGTNLFLAAMCVAACIATVRLARADGIEIDPDSFGAIAYSPSTGLHGYSYNYEDEESAQQAAVAACKAKDARAVCWVHDGFCALAVGDNKAVWGVGYRFGSGVTTVDTKNAALVDCGKKTTNAHILICISSDGQYIDEPKAIAKKKAAQGGSDSNKASPDQGDKPYTGLSDGKPHPIRKITNPNGSWVEDWSDGTKIIKNADGSSVEKRPDGTRIVKNVNGSSIVTKPDGTEIITNANGSVVEKKPDGTKSVKTANGGLYVLKPDGTEIITNPNGSTVEKRRDGTRIIKNADGSSVETRPDGTEIIRNKDGSSVQTNPDGSKIITNADGTRVVEEAGKDGK